MLQLIPQSRIDEIVKRIVESYKPEKIILFGSYALGTPTVHSDLDLFIIKNTATQPIERGVEIHQLIRDIIVPTDILVYTPNEVKKNKNRKFTFVYEVFKTGKILYERLS